MGHLLLLSLACAPPELPEGELQARYTITAPDGGVAGSVEQIGAEGGLAERARYTLNERPEELQELWLPTQNVSAARLMTQHERAWGQVKWRQPTWTRRQGAALHHLSLEEKVEALVLESGLGTSPAMWALNLAEPRDSRLALELSSGRRLTLRAEQREALTLTVNDAPISAARFFAWTPAQGASIWRSDSGEILAITGPAGLRIAREGLVWPEVPPQAPPADIVEREVSVTRPDLTLRGTWSAPAQGAPQGRVLLVHGSGPADRDGNFGALKLNLYRDLAWQLSEQGYEVLRYDKRGVAGSSADPPPQGTVPELLGDARAWIESEGGDCWFVIGHSEGGMLAPALAQDPVRGVITLAGPARPLREVTEEQAGLIARAHGFDDAEVLAASQRSDAAMRAIAAGRERDLGMDPLGQAIGLSWLRSHLEYDVVTAWRSLATPALALFAEQDLQVPPSDAERLRDLLVRAGHEDHDIQVLPGLDHLFMATPTPGLGVYADPDRHLSALVLDAIGPWLRAHPCEPPHLDAEVQ